MGRAGIGWGGAGGPFAGLAEKSLLPLPGGIRSAPGPASGLAWTPYPLLVLWCMAAAAVPLVPGGLAWPSPAPGEARHHHSTAACTGHRQCCRRQARRATVEWPHDIMSGKGGGGVREGCMAAAAVPAMLLPAAMLCCLALLCSIAGCCHCGRRGCSDHCSATPWDLLHTFLCHYILFFYGKLYGILPLRRCKGLSLL